MIQIPEDIEAEVDVAHIDYVLNGEVVGSVTIEIRSDLVKDLGSADEWKKVFQKAIHENAGLVALKRNVQ